MVTYTYNGNNYVNYKGNYYSDYAGSDGAGDGIGDTPYGNDNYPLLFCPVAESKETPWISTVSLIVILVGVHLLMRKRN
jgi:hypothetical protein